MQGTIWKQVSDVRRFFFFAFEEISAFHCAFDRVAVQARQATSESEQMEKQQVLPGFP